MCSFHEKEGIMAESSLNLSDEEHKFLVALLEIALRDTRIEEHRTRTITYREHILHREQLIASLLHKLGKTTV
jgi:hypothetical protein